MVWLIHSGVSSFATSLCSGRSIQSQPRFAAKSFVSLGTFLEQSLPKHPSSQPHGLVNLFCIPKKVWSKASPFLPTQAQGTELICSDAPHTAHHHHLHHFESHLAPESDDGRVHKGRLYLVILSLLITRDVFQAQGKIPPSTCFG